jgi:hypothetical protein
MSVSCTLFALNETLLVTKKGASKSLVFIGDFDPDTLFAHIPSWGIHKREEQKKTPPPWKEVIKVIKKYIYI